RFTGDLPLVGGLLVGAQKQSAAIIRGTGKAVIAVGVDLQQPDRASEVGFNRAQVRHSGRTAILEVTRIKLMSWLAASRHWQTHVISASLENVSGQGTSVIRRPTRGSLVNDNVHRA